MSHICIMALIGLPGSGKTTLSKQLLQSLYQLNVIHICYDDIIAFKNTQIGQFEWSKHNYKEGRHYILNEIVFKIIATIKANGNINERNFPINVKLNSSASNYLIICDDNNYYRSMRYELYQLARLNNISYIQLHLKCNTTKALKRNTKRCTNDIVPEEIILNMAKKLEIPSMSLLWEKNSIILDIEERIDQKDIEYQILPYIMEAYKAPVKSFVDNSTNNSTDATCNIEQSRVHKLDLLLRKRVKEIMESDATISNNEKRQKAEFLNKRRKEIIDEYININRLLPPISESNNESSLTHFVQLLNK